MKHILTLASLFIVLGSAAQTTKTTTPKYFSSWGKVSSGNVALDQLNRIVDSSLTVKDDKGNILPVTGFRINYTFVSTYKDQESGELKTAKEFRAYDVTDGGVLTQMWKESIQENAKPGDEIVLNKIMARLKNGKKTYAPDIKLRVVDK